MKKALLAFAAIAAIAGSIMSPALACSGKDKCKDKPSAPAPAPDKS